MKDRDMEELGRLRRVTKECRDKINMALLSEDIDYEECAENLLPKIHDLLAQEASDADVLIRDAERWRSLCCEIDDGNIFVEGWIGRKYINRTMSVAEIIAEIDAYEEENRGD